MSGSKRQLLAVPMFACLLLIGAKAVRAFGVESLRDDSKGKTQVSTLPLDTMNGLEVQGIGEKDAGPVKIQSGVGNYRGRRAVRLVNDDGPVGTVSGGQVLAIIKGSDFEDGTIEAEIAGFPRQGAKPSTRGFIGVAFRVQDHGSRYESFYLRMTNVAAGEPRRLRILCRPRPRGMDQDQGCGVR
jgi:hypothetical protein